jgi:hypothetical protein
LRRKTTRTELRRYFRQWLDTAFQNKLINRYRREDMLRAMEDHLPAIVASLNSRGTAKLDLGKTTALKFFLREGLDPSDGKFNLFEIQRTGMNPHRKLRCFVGHRFVKPVSESIRMNLRYVLEPSGIELIWSGMDMLAIGFFDDIIKKIKKCDFCIFDNRLASEKPNVYIEAGISYALGKPFILANYQGNRLGIPSDLTHILNIPYRGYEDLCKVLYFNLPVFLRENRLR